MYVSMFHISVNAVCMHTYVCMHVWINECMQPSMPLCIYIYVYTYMYVSMSAKICMYADMYVSSNAPMYVCCVCSDVYLHRYTRVDICGILCGNHFVLDHIPYPLEGTGK